MIAKHREALARLLPAALAVVLTACGGDTTGSRETAVGDAVVAV